MKTLNLSKLGLQFYYNRSLNIIKLKKFLDPEIPVLSKKLINKLDSCLNIADVGSSGLPPEEFFSAFEKSIFHCFDPDSRAKKSAFSNIIFYSKALFSSAAEKKLFLTRMPDASSLLEPNKEFLDMFLNAKSSDVIKEDKINLSTLDIILNEEERIDFLKVDAEGADLEVIKGGERSLSDCLGIKIEVQYKERNIGSPLFLEVDNYLRNKFFLLNLKNSSWLKSKEFFINSNAELVWADAYYLKNDKSFLKSYFEKNCEERKIYLTKYIVIGCLMGAHDHLIYFLKNKMTELKISEEEKKEFISGIISSRKNVFLQSSISLIFALFFSFSLLFFYPIKKIRKKLIIYLRKNISFLGSVLIFLSRNSEEGTIIKN